MDFLEELIASDGFVALRVVRPKWSLDSLDELRETVSEFQIIDACKPIGLCTKSQVKALQGLLNKRNECAHPSDYYPALNDTLGFISEVLQRIESLRNKKPALANRSSSGSSAARGPSVTGKFRHQSSRPRHAKDRGPNTSTP
jgi:hypothetical protein